MTTPTPEDDVKQLRDALALGPQAWDYDSNMRPFYNDPEGNSRGGECDGTYTLYGADFDIDGETYEGPTLSERCKIADAKFINAANPARIARLLDHIEAQAVRLEAAERDAERYRWLRDKADYVRLPEGSPQVVLTDEWGCIISLLPRAYPRGAGLDDAIDTQRAAIASEKTS